MEKMVTTSFFYNKKILITGDTGFKGSWLAFWLHGLGAKVYGYALPPESDQSLFTLLELDNLINHVDGNLLDDKLLLDYFNEVKPDIVFHLAAQALVRYSYDEPKLTFETNVTGSINLLEAVRHCDSVKSLIYVTSDKCYKNREWVWGYRENDELGGHDPYSASKAAAEIVFASYKDSFFSKNSNLGIASVRAGNVIGGGDWALDRIVPDCIRSIMASKDIEIRNPNATRPWQHVLEPLSGYMLLAEKLYMEPTTYSGSWNFGPSIESIRTVEELSNKAVEILGAGRVIVNKQENQKHEAGLLHLNCDKSHHNLNWKSVWNFDQTVSITINWYKNFLKGMNVKEITQQNINQFMEEKYL